MSTVVIVGGGQGGFQTAASLRSGGHQGPIVLLADEPYRPYQRPPLSKGFVKDEVAQEALFFRKSDYFTANDIDLRLETRVDRVDRAGKEVTTASGDRIAYDHLVLATGARVRPLPVPGADLSGVLYVRTLEDALELKARLHAGKRVVVVGGGFIGLEAAAVANELGCHVTVLEALDRLMARVVPPLVSEFFLGLHREHGVDVRLGTVVSAVEGEGGRVTGVRLRDGTLLPADLVIVGIGVLPNVELAAEAGLECRDGILVDELLRTSDPDIFAIGDCARFPHPSVEGPVRLESVQNALDQGKAVAATILGEASPYSALPWFWSDQFHLKLQMAGLATGHDQTVLRGDPAAKSFSIFYYRAGEMVSVDSVNRPGDHMVARRLLTSGVAVSPEQAGDDGFALKSLL
ncbi:MAG: FAD-dependent oxidoreductase [Geminicoccaceae bacterium]